MYRGHHFTDIPMSGNLRRRKIGSFINYRMPNGQWATTAPGLAVASDRRPIFAGPGAPTFSRGSEAAPLQFWSGDTSDPSNTTTIAMSSDTTPDASFAVTLMNPDAVVAMQSSGTVSSWPNVVTNGTLRWIHTGATARKEIVLSAPGHAFAWRFRIRLAPGCTFSLANNVYIIRNPSGTIVFVGRAPYGYDAGGEIDGKLIRCTLTQVGTWGPGGVWPEIELAAEEADFDGAVYPVVIEPSTNISGTTAIEDTMMKLGGGTDTFNYGSGSTVDLRNVAGAHRRGLVRISDESLIPAGTLNIVTFNLYLQSTYFGMSWTAYKVAAANAAWAEGTGDGSAAQAGTACWSYLAYDATTPTSWAGSAGLSTAGTDYDTDASPPTLSGDLGASQAWDLGSDGVTWATDWRDNPSNNGGILIFNASSSAQSFASTEAANPPTFDIDYTAPAGHPCYVRIYTVPHFMGRSAVSRRR